MPFEKKIFLSYSHENYEIVDEIDNDFITFGITMTRDVRDLEPFGNITDYMTLIGEADFIMFIRTRANITFLCIMLNNLFSIK